MSDGFFDDQNRPHPLLLKRLLKYDPDTGLLTWLWRTPDLMEAKPGSKHSATRRASMWNARYAGTPAYTAADDKGYLTGKLFGRTYKAHRVAWAIAKGAWPDGEIDHINGVRDDNRLVNLRGVSRQENNRNARRRRDNTSGVCGVYWHKGKQKWRAHIKVDGRKVHLGYFPEKTDAIAARQAAEIEFGFHPNHGLTDDARADA